MKCCACRTGLGASPASARCTRRSSAFWRVMSYTATTGSRSTFSRFGPSSGMSDGPASRSCAREFLVKDARSFHADKASLRQPHELMHAPYCRTFGRCCLDYRPIAAVNDINQGNDHCHHGNHGIKMKPCLSYTLSPSITLAGDPTYPAYPDLVGTMVTVDGEALERAIRDCCRPGRGGSRGGGRRSGGAGRIRSRRGCVRFCRRPSGQY